MADGQITVLIENTAARNGLLGVRGAAGQGQHCRDQDLRRSEIPRTDDVEPPSRTSVCDASTPGTRG
jgi:hypothetical protein